MVYYLGSKNTLGHYANTRLLDGDPQKIEVADTSPDDGFDSNSARAYPANQGRAVRPDNVPTRIEWQEKAPVPDVEIQHGMLVVSSLFRQTVEMNEPSLHQFLPVTYLDAAGHTIAERYYFVACNRIDSVSRNRTTMILYKGSRWVSPKVASRLHDFEMPSNFDANAIPKLVFSSSAINGFQAWCDKFLPMIGPIVSNGLGEALMSKNLSGLELSKAEEE